MMQGSLLVLVVVLVLGISEAISSSSYEGGEMEIEKQEELRVLHEFYLSTGGDVGGWQYSTDDVQWDFTVENSSGVERYSSDPCFSNTSTRSAWAGITCTNSSLNCSSASLPVCRISHLRLPNRNLTGSLSLSLGNLSLLEELVLYENKLSSSIPSTLWNLTGLTRLDLEDNRLTGELPLGLNQLKLIERFYLSHNLLTGTLPDELTSLTNMNKIYLTNNLFEGTIPQGFEALVKLNTLFMNQNQFTGSIPSGVSLLSKLRYLSFSRTDISGHIPNEMSKLSSLAFLYLWGTSISGPLPPELGYLNLLQYFYCYSTFLTGTLPDTFSQLTSMRVMSFRSNYITGTLPPSWGVLSDLEFLFLYHNLVTGTIPNEWGGLTGLQEVHLHVNMLSGSIPSELENLVSLEFMYLYRNYMSGTLPAEIGGLTSLVQFFASDNYFSGALPTSLGLMVSLEVLDVSTNFFTGQIPSQLGYLREIKNLLMGNNMLTQNLPPSLGTLENLIDLRAEGNLLSGSLSPLFDYTERVLPLLTILDVSDNIISGSVPSGLFLIPNINVVVLSLNCFGGSLPSSMCSAHNCSVLSMDGLGAAFGCRDATKIPITNVHVFNTLDGTFPNCLLQLPKLRVLHLTGNGLGGTLSSSYTESLLPVRNMSLAHNAISGTIPIYLQAHDFDSLDLSYNQLTGEYDTIGSSGKSKATVVLEVNRLSGNFPRRLSGVKAPLLDVINGNIFSCSSSNDYDLDENSEEYTCGSQALDTALLTFVSILGVFCFSLLVMVKAGHGIASNRFYKLVSGFVIYWSYIQSLRSQLWKEYPILVSISFLDSDIYNVSLIMVSLLVVIGALGLPIFVLKLVDDVYVTHTHQYRYLFSSAFASGTGPAVCLIVMLAGVGFLILFICYRHARICVVKVPVFSTTNGLLNGDNACKDNRNICDVDNTHSSIKILLDYVKVLIPFIISGACVATINGFYVYSTLQAMHPLSHSLIEFSLALFNAVYNKVSLPLLLRPISDSGKQIRSGFYVVIFNNVIVPLAASAFTSPKCFKGLLLEPEPLISFYSFTVCDHYELDRDGNRYCSNYISSYRSVPPVVSPYIYNYQCSNAILQSYIPIYVYMYTVRFLFLFIVAVILPSIRYESIPKFFRRALKTVLWPDVHTRHLSADQVLSYRDVAIHDIMTPLLIAVTFGAVSPLLLVVLTVSTILRLQAWKMLVGRFVFLNVCDRAHTISEKNGNRNSDLRHVSNPTIVTDDSAHSLSLLSQCYIPLKVLLDACVWPLLISCTVFFSVLSWDYLGDSVGARTALWAPLACWLVLIVLWLVQRYLLSTHSLEVGTSAVGVSGINEVSSPIHHDAL